MGYLAAGNSLKVDLKDIFALYPVPYVTKMVELSWLHVWTLNVRELVYGRKHPRLLNSNFTFSAMKIKK